MNLVFVSNFYNHHQASLCNALWQGAEAFHFVQTAPMDPERQRLGWDMASFPPYVTADASVLDQADVVLAGSAPEALIRRAVLAGKPVLRYSERPLKNGAEPLKYLPRLVRWHHRNPTGKRVYLLCASAYAAADYAGFAAAATAGVIFRSAGAMMTRIGCRRRRSAAPFCGPGGFWIGSIRMMPWPLSAASRRKG